MKTIKEWLMELPEPIRSRALKYEGKQLRQWGKREDNLRDAVCCFVDWGETTEDEDYWACVSNGKFTEAEALLDSRKTNSTEANKSVDKETVYQIILDTLLAHNKDGMTKDEISRHSTLTPEQVHKRMSELEKLGKICPNGKRKGNSGRSQTVWKLI